MCLGWVLNFCDATVNTPDDDANNDKTCTDPVCIR